MAVNEGENPARSPRKRSPTTSRDPTESLVVHLHGPGLTPILRAGVGGLAASLHAILHARDPIAPWMNGIEVPLGPGSALVQFDRITFTWPGDGLEATFRALWEGSFQVSHGVIHVPGAQRQPFDGTQLSPIWRQEALKATFLQHGQSTNKVGSERILTFDHGDGPLTFTYQPFEAFAHMYALDSFLEGLRTGRPIELAGWASPGAAQRHVAHGRTRAEYTPEEALAALFGIVGCIPFPATVGGGGFLVAPEPNDLVDFGRRLPGFLPFGVAES